MRIGTQGIDLGSRDTSGEDNDDGADSDSDLDGFVARSSDPIEMASSSQDGLPRRRKRPGLKKGMTRAQSTLSAVEEMSDSGQSISDDSVKELPVLNKGKKKRIVEDSESDE
jgi:ATP-dependent DNA helicase MPH1